MCSQSLLVADGFINSILAYLIRKIVNKCNFFVLDRGFQFQGVFDKNDKDKIRNHD